MTNFLILAANVENVVLANDIPVATGKPKVEMRFRRSTSCFKLVDVCKRPNVQLFEGYSPVVNDVKADVKAVYRFDTTIFVEALANYFRYHIWSLSTSDIRTLCAHMKLHTDTDEIALANKLASFIAVCVVRILKERAKFTRYRDFTDSLNITHLYVPEFVARMLRLMSAGSITYMSPDRSMVITSNVEWNIPMLKASDTFIADDLSLYDVVYHLSRFYRQFFPGMPMINLVEDRFDLTHLNGFGNVGCSLKEGFVEFTQTDSSTNDDAMIAYLFKAKIEVSGADSYRMPIVTRYPGGDITNIFYGWIADNLFTSTTYFTSMEGQRVQERFDSESSAPSRTPRAPKRKMYTGKGKKFSNRRDSQSSKPMSQEPKAAPVVKVPSNFFGPSVPPKSAT